MPFVSRAGQKLDHALTSFQIDVTGLTCADLGCNTGGFTDCLLQRGAKNVYAIDTGYGALEYKLRKDPRVVTMERTNAMHVTLPEPMDFICIDVAWTKQKNILPSARRLIAPNGKVVTLLKPHYEADPSLLVKGVLPSDKIESVKDHVIKDITEVGFRVLRTTESPILGGKGNHELLLLLEPC